ncbi:MAG: substrate-binding domain-containing protein [Simplicispira sp.]|nr:substrate-binding domain-containing protein [Simplicispira sp.]
MKFAQLSGCFRSSFRVALWACALVAVPAHADQLKLGGTGNSLGTLRLLGAAFSEKYPGIQVTVLNSLGTSGAIKAVPKGAIDIGVASRPLTDEELKNNLVATEYARTTTVIAVSTNTRVTAITREQLADMLTWKLSQWPDGRTIRPVLRQPGDDNSTQLRRLSPAIERALASAESRQGLPFAVTDQEAADKIESIPGAIGVTTLALIKSEKRNLRALTLDHVAPTPAEAISGKYPLVKRFYFITTTAPPENIQKFIAFTQSPAGQNILIQTGHWLP